MNKKQTIVHRYKNHFSWRGNRFANNKVGHGLLTNEIVDAGFSGMKIVDHRSRQRVGLTPREQM